MATAAAMRLSRRLGPHSRPNRLQALDRRSVEWQRLEQIRSDWLEHLGRRATVAQLTLIEVIATSTLFAELLERDAFVNHGGIMPERSARQYNAYLNAKSRAARQLGLKPAQQPPQSLAELFAPDDAEEEEEPPASATPAPAVPAALFRDGDAAD